MLEHLYRHIYWFPPIFGCFNQSIVLWSQEFCFCFLFVVLSGPPFWCGTKQTNQSLQGQHGPMGWFHQVMSNLETGSRSTKSSTVLFWWMQPVSEFVYFSSSTCKKCFQVMFFWQVLCWSCFWFEHMWVLLEWFDAMRLDPQGWIHKFGGFTVAILLVRLRWSKSDLKWCHLIEF